MNMNAALILFSEAVALDNNNITTLMSRSDFLFKNRNYELALEDALLIIRKDFRCRVAFYRAFDCYLSLGEICLFEELVNKFKREHPNIDSIFKNQVPKCQRLKMLLEDIVDLKTSRNYEKVVISADEALKIAPGCTQLRLTKLRYLEALKRYRELENELRINNQAFDCAFVDALKFYYAANLPDSLKLFTSLADNQPKQLKILDEILSKIKRMTKAINGGMIRYLNPITIMKLKTFSSIYSKCTQYKTIQ